MGFSKVVSRVRTKVPRAIKTTDDVSLAVYKQSDTLFSVNVILSGRLLEELGWKPKDRAALFIGEGTDKGIARIVLDDNGYTLCQSQYKRGGAALVRFLSPPEFVTELLPRKEIGYGVETDASGNKQLILKLPTGFYKEDSKEESKRAIVSDKAKDAAKKQLAIEVERRMNMVAAASEELDRTSRTFEIAYSKANALLSTVLSNFDKGKDIDVYR